MSDLTPDELISAYLDDEVSAAERAAIETDASALARLDQLRAVREAVAAPVTALSDTDRERLIGAALAASETSPAVTSIAVARADRGRSWRPLIAVAAALALIALAVPVLRNVDLGRDASDTASTSLDSATDEPAAAEAAAEPTELSREEEGAGAADSDAAEMLEAPTAEATTADMAAAAAEPAAEEAAEEAPGDGAAMIFNPLDTELGDFTTTDMVVERVFADFEDWVKDPDAINLRNAVLAEDAASDDGAIAPCALVLALTGLVDEQSQRLDTATASVGGVDHVIWLLDDGTVHVAPIELCAPITTASFFEG